MELDALLDVMDRAAANVEKLDLIWRRAAPQIPDVPVHQITSIEYEDLARTWLDLLTGLPPIDGWTVTTELPDPRAVGQAFIACLSTGVSPSISLYEARVAPERELAEYRYRLGRARRRAARHRLEELVGLIDAALPVIINSIPRDSTPHSTELTDGVVQAVAEVERLLGSSVVRRGRWGDMHRHFAFSQAHDWYDIAEMDWPSAREDIVAAGFADADPLPVPPDIDLGSAAKGSPSGKASTALMWGNIDAEAFERLLFELLQALPGFQNVQWLTRSNAPDRGRDLSADRVFDDGAGGVRNERVIIQAKHWQSRSLATADIAANVAQVRLWQPPLVHGLIVATSGRFTSDAVAWTEQHNNTGTFPRVDLWPDNKLETLLSSHPWLVPAHGLR